MHFVKCEICEQSEIVFDMERTGTGYKHPHCFKVELPKPKRKTTHDETAADAVETATAINGRKRFRVLPEVVGFDQSEEGSEGRYVKRRTEQPWTKHTFWWVVHNAIAHPLIGLVPWGPMFRFHDWTSKKMHGR